MASLAVPAVEGAAIALLRALGVVAVGGAGAVAVNEAAKRKTDAAEKAKSAPIAQAGSQARARDACAKCPPDCGTLVTRNWNMSEESRAYQARITGFVPGTEWNFHSIDFDGFHSAQCLLLEAKAKYDQFFNPSTKQPKMFFTVDGLPKIIQQATMQSGIVRASPPSQLHWHFMEPLSYAYFRSQFRLRLLNITTLLTP